MAEEKLTFEKVWQALMELKEQTEKQNKELDARWEKQNAELNQQISGITKSQEKQNAELNRQIGGITKSQGAITEALIFNTLEKDMIFGGIEFDDIRPNMGYHSKRLGIRAEFDMVLTNGNYVAIVETKTKVDQEDVSELITKKLNDFRKLYPEYANHKIIFGIGGMSFDKRAVSEANKNGIGLIKVAGDKVEFHTEGIKVY